MRVATRRNKDGTPVRYLQLAHNEWDPAAKASKTRVLHSFGREDQLDVAGVAAWSMRCHGCWIRPTP